jgi:hypothetical protein
MKIEVENAQQNEQVDWNRNPQLVMFENVIVLTDKYQTSTDENNFCGTRIDDADVTHYSKHFEKHKFKHFHGKITLSND